MINTNDSKDFLRGNPKLKAPGTKEFISKDDILFRINEIQKIMNDPIYFAEKYFYIVNGDTGRHLIKVYPKQAEMIRSMCKYNRSISLSCRQAGKSTSYSIVVLWYAINNRDKNILICANRFSTAKDILSRIKLAYEELPMWLKPGLLEWNAGSVTFDNGCKISAEATSANSGRGGSVNLLVCDEFAFLNIGIEQAFMQSVFPVVSSSKTSKIIIVSTPNGMGNEFYKIWNRAILDMSDNDDQTKWHPTEINWYDVPGRDEKWKAQQLETFGGDESKFLQEYGNSFLGSAETLISSETIKKIKTIFEKEHIKPTEISLNKNFPEIKIKIFHKPEKFHSYVIGVDPSMGVGSDYQALCVWDITNTFDIKHVASFYRNDVPPKIFAYIIAKLGIMYNTAYVAIENNGLSQAVLDSLYSDYDYDSIVNEGGNIKTNIGIHSMLSRKMDACLNFKNILEDEKRRIEINDGILINELEKFERKNRLGKLPSYEAADGHDDYVMATIWAFFILIPEILERYYDIKKSVLNNLGKSIPLYVLPYTYNNIEEFNSSLFDDNSSFNKEDNFNDIDNKINDFIENKDKEINENQQNDEDNLFQFGGGAW